MRRLLLAALLAVALPALAPSASACHLSGDPFELGGELAPGLGALVWYGGCGTPYCAAAWTVGSDLAVCLDPL